MSLPLDIRSNHRDSLGTLEKQLICPICLEVFTKPVVILPCLHNLCRKCANELYQVGVGGRFRCPSCRHDVVLDRHGVYGLQRNLLVENIIDVYKQESARSDLNSRPPPKPLAQLTCEEHDDEKLNIYCITCQVPSCSLCKVFGAHKNCQVAPLSNVYEQQKTELSDGVTSLVSTNDRVQAFVNELEAICRNIEENSRIQKQILCEKFDRMSAILEERRKIMTQQITYEEEEKAGWAQSLVQTYSGHVDTNSKLVQAALNAMEEPEMVAFVQTSKDLIENVGKASTCFTLETLEPGYENMDHYKVDFNAEERVLYELDFMKIEEEVEDTPDEPKSEPEPEPECEPEPVPTPEPDHEPDQGLKSEDSEMSSPMPETIENTWGQAEECADVIKEPVYERNGLSTQQSQAELVYEEHDAGDLGIQSSSTEAGEEVMLYPSWHMSNSWQVISSSLAKSIEVSAEPDNKPQHMREPDTHFEFQQPQPLPFPSINSFTHVTAENQTSQLEGSCLDDALGLSVMEDNGSELVEGSADRGGMTLLSSQTGIPAGSALEELSPPVVTSEPTRLSFSFSWLNALAKKK